MSVQWVLIEPHDTVFFRDGRPFNQDDEGAAHLASLFPPSPRVVAQMLRAALAAGQGWTAGNWMRVTPDWPQEKANAVVGVLGSGPTLDGSKLSFKSPRLVRLTGTGKAREAEPIYPVPLAIVARMGTDGAPSELRRLVPDWNSATRRTDIGANVLPVIEGTSPGGGWKTLEGWYVSQAGLEKFLGGCAPLTEQLIAPHHVSASEPRVGIWRDRGSRTVNRGALFATDHRRLAAPPRSTGHPPVRTAICTGIVGANDWKPASCRPFGGEHRFAWIDDGTAVAQPPSCELAPSAGGVIRYTATNYTPVLFRNDWAPELQPPDLPGRLVSAVIGKPLMIGGWSSIETKKAAWGPRAMRPHVPAGSTWFMEVTAKQIAEGDGLREAIGEETRSGYGGCVYGIWHSQEGRRS